MSGAGVDLQVEDFDVERDVCGVVDGDGGRAEAGEFGFSAGVVVEGQRHVHAVGVKVGFPGIV